jgi:hypothetical protein
MPEELLIAGALLLLAVLLVWLAFLTRRIRRRRVWQSKRPIHVKVATPPVDEPE